MPCYTQVMVSLENTKWNIRAREKLGLNAKGQLTADQANQVRLEAGKLKTVSIIKSMNPTAMVTGLNIGSRKLTLKLNI